MLRRSSVANSPDYYFRTTRPQSTLMCWSNLEVFAFRCDSNNHMNEFPKFMKDPSNKIMTSHQATPGVAGYVFDGAEGSQMAFWTCEENASSGTHVHEFDEYMLVVQGCYTLMIDERRIPVTAGRIRYFARDSSCRRSLGWYQDNPRVWWTSSRPRAAAS